MAGNGDVESARYKVMLQSLQQQDPEIDHVVAYSKFVVVYLLHQDGPNPGWRKAHIEGPVYLVRRRLGAGRGRYQLLVKNQFSTKDLLDDVHPGWELDCQQNYVFCKIDDASQRIRGLWFHDDSERGKIEASLETVLEEIRRAPPDGLGLAGASSAGAAPGLGLQGMARAQGPVGAPGSQLQLLGGFPQGAQGRHPMPTDGSADALYAQFGLVRPHGGEQFGPQGGALQGGALQQAWPQGGWGAAPAANQGPAQGTVMVTEASLRSALRSLADNDFFIQAISQKLQEQSL